MIVSNRTEKVQRGVAILVEIEMKAGNNYIYTS